MRKASGEIVGKIIDVNPSVPEERLRRIKVMGDMSDMSRSASKLSKSAEMNTRSRIELSDV
jgi:hypothetical protein